MTRSLTVVRMVALVTAIAAAALPIRAASGVSGDIHWVRGTVSASTSRSLSVTAGDRCLVLKMDPSTVIVGSAGLTTNTSSPAIASGALVQAHFRTTDGKVAVVVIDRTTAPTSSRPAKREGTSVRGEVERVSRGSVSVRFERGARDLTLDDRTTLVDRDGHLRATGAQSVVPLLSSGVDVLITWVTDGEGAANSSHRRAVEIRTLAPAATGASPLTSGAR
jgi:hypothetical protein